MVTIKQIAECAGVSTTTVSNVIHGKTKKVSAEKIELIQRLIDEMGYVTPLGLSVLHKSRSRMVAVIINRHQVYDQSILSDPFYGSIVGYIEEELHKSGYYMLFYSADNTDEIFNMVMTWNVDAVILLSMAALYCEKIQQMVKKPVICIDPIGKPKKTSGVATISLDDEKGGYLMSKYLIQEGYEVIHICGGRVDMGVDECRVKGAMRALRDSGKGKEVQIFAHSAGISYPERERFYKNMYRGFQKDKKTAVFCLADRYAFEVNSFLQERGVSIPEDIGIAGFDGVSSAAKNTYPRLTTIRQNLFQKSELAVREVITAVEQPDYKMNSHIVDVGLIIRKST
ncbi:MAG: LacI family DNA-binding transcriptional regulator [Lachnospiraceae bacterium]|nr:LacI family DNA-binding transcriptional regulator [Lachnospiraceae bacterium]